MECCGIERESSYCPDCGGELESNVIGQITVFVQGRLNQLLAVNVRSEKYDKDHPERLQHESTMRYVTEKRKRRARKIKRFQKWIEVLESMKDERSKP